MTRIELDDGKYTVVHDSGAGLHALRYGEHWRDMTGDGLVLAMAQEIEDLRRRIVPVQQVSVPDGWRELAKRADDFLYSLPETDGVLRLRADLCSMLAAIKAQEPVAAVKHGPLDSDGWPEFVRVETIGDFDLENLPSGMKLYAAPAAPAADAGLVEALGYQVLFDAIAAATSVYANGAINISVQAFRAALAAYRAKGVV